MIISGFKILAVGALICLAAVLSRAQQTDFAQIKLSDLAGKQVQSLQKSDAKAIVFLFIQTECPLSNRYAPEIKRLYEKYNSGGVTFWLVYPDKDDSAEKIQKHLAEYDYKIGVLRDVGHKLVKATGVSVTPEAAVFVPSNDGMQMIYRGRIDDRTAAFGKTRPAATTHDLDEVLEMIVSGKPLTNKTTLAIGCSISDLD
jgi:peroxiredoxin